MASKKKDIIFKETEPVYYLIITSKRNDFIGKIYDVCETGDFKINHRVNLCDSSKLGYIPSRGTWSGGVWRSRTKADLVNDSNGVTSLVMKESDCYPGCALVRKDDYGYKLFLLSKDQSNFQSIIDKHEKIKIEIAKEEKKKRLDLLNLEVKPGVVYMHRKGPYRYYKIDSIDEENDIISFWELNFRGNDLDLEVIHVSRQIEEFKTYIDSSENHVESMFALIERSKNKFKESEKKLVNFIISQ